jgi:flavin-dependent dehydrogenase
MMSEFDIAIVGGGLAGLAAAIEMGKAEKKVVLFEKRTYPYHKVCGEYISMESWNYLKYLGVELDKMDLPQIDQLSVSDLNGNLLRHQLQLGGFGISRFTLDAELAKIARQSGVQLMEDCRVEEIIYDEKQDLHAIKTPNGYFYSTLLVASYGKRSRLDKQWDREFIKKPLPADRNFTGVKYHIQADLPADQIALHIFDGGYCGISKVEGEDRYCFCYLTLASAVQEAGGIEALEEKVMRKNPFLDRLLDLPRLYKKPEVIAQVNFSSRSQVEEHAFMLGDAAGLIVPLCGNGMSMALHAAHLWSKLAKSYFDGELSRSDFEQDYQKAWQKQFKIRLAVGRGLQTTFYKPSMSSLLIKLLNKSQWLTKKLVDFTHGKEILNE